MPSGPIIDDYSGYDNQAYLSSPAPSARHNHYATPTGAGDSEEYRPSSSTDILYSVKEQEAQFEQLSRELEAERQSVANQLERCKLGSDTNSISSVPSSNDITDWRLNDHSQVSARDQSGSQLYDSCIKVLQDRGVMHVGDNYYGEEDVNDQLNENMHRIPGDESYRQVETYKTTSLNGPNHPNHHIRQNSLGSESPHSSRLSVNSNISNDLRAKRTMTTTVTTKVTTHSQVYHNGPYNSGGLDSDPHSPNGNYGSHPPSPNERGGAMTGIHIEHRLDQSYEGSESLYPDPRHNHNYYNSATLPIRDTGPADTSYDSRGVEPHYASERPLYADPYNADSPLNNSFNQRNYPGPDQGQGQGLHPEQMYHSNQNYSILPQQDLDRSRESDGYPSGYTGADPRNESFASVAPNGEYRPLREQYSQDESFRRSPSPVGPPVRRYEDNSRPPNGDPYNNGGPNNPNDIGRDSIHNLSAPPDRFQPANSPDDGRWRNPDLHEVIEFLSHPSNSIKANAAAYLQHLTFGDNDVKQKTRALNGIPALIDLLNNDTFDVHKNALGALRNLSFGRDNDENKRAVKNADGLPALVRHLRKSPDNDIRELVTAILWNLSSCKDLKKPIIDDALTVLINNIIIPHSGWDANADMNNPKDIYWSTVFRNASGVLRNVSSEGEYGRKKLRECDGLVDAIMYIVRAAIGKNDIDNKSVENCVCVLRNLCYGCQEVQDPDYWKKKQSPKANGKPGTKPDMMGCFGAGKKKKSPLKDDKIPDYQKMSPVCDPQRGMGLLWAPDVVHVYLPLLSDCSNPETLEASAGAIQNLAACEWQPSIEIRAAVRKEKGLPVIVELLNIEEDRVVCAAATSLRNLALDQRNKELIGKYAMHKLIQKLPHKTRRSEHPPSDATIAAVLATLYEVVKNNPDFCQTLLNNEGVDRLVDITSSRGEYSSKVVKFAASILFAMWQFKDLHEDYKRHGYKESHFVTKTMAARSASGRPMESANNTLVRPRQDMGRPGAEFNQSTLPPIDRRKYHDTNNIPHDTEYGHENPQFGGNHVPAANSVFDSQARQTTGNYSNYNDLHSNHVHSPVANDNRVPGSYGDQTDGGTRSARPDYHNDSRILDNSVGGSHTGGYHGDGRHDTSIRGYQDDINPYGTATIGGGRGLMNESRDSDRFVEPYGRDDRMLLKGAATEDIALHEMTNPSYSTSGDYHHGAGYRPAGGVSVIPGQTGTEPLYARVNKAQKSHRQNHNTPHVAVLDTSGAQDGGDSWV